MDSLTGWLRYSLVKINKNDDSLPPRGTKKSILNLILGLFVKRRFFSYKIVVMNPAGESISPALYRYPMNARKCADTKVKSSSG
jgi:hypothetical protein